MVRNLRVAADRLEKCRARILVFALQQLVFGMGERGCDILVGRAIAREARCERVGGVLERTAGDDDFGVAVGLRRGGKGEGRGEQQDRHAGLGHMSLRAGDGAAVLF
ncbi:MAG: hypothetical protein A2885_08435 [Sphingopyxis sp. RIFCSPHIGHO2_01_FULL_65_24]|nr:MAG: hypothetical protein A2885_08435 [Sphingopyxis sp. RIFCSPHIGHO2_01_FULL_65_24]